MLLGKGVEPDEQQWVCIECSLQGNTGKACHLILPTTSGDAGTLVGEGEFSNRKLKKRIASFAQRLTAVSGKAKARHILFEPLIVTTPERTPEVRDANPGIKNGETWVRGST